MEGHTFPEFQPNTVDWYLPREARRDLQIVWLQRTNLLLLGASGPTRMVLEMLKLDLREPVMTWRPGQPLDLPPPGRAATLILHDVDELTSPDQHAMLRWLEQNAGQTRVVQHDRGAAMAARQDGRL